MPYRIKHRGILKVILRMEAGLGIGFGFVGIYMGKQITHISNIPYVVVIGLSILALAYGVAAVILYGKILAKKKLAPQMRLFIKANWIRFAVHIILIPIFLSDSTPIGLFYLVAQPLAIAFLTFLESRQVIETN